MEDNIIKVIKNIENFLKLKQENKAIKCKIIRDIRNHLEQQEEDHNKPATIGNFWSNDYI